MSSISDDDSAYSYSYDTLGRVTSIDNYGTSSAPNVVLDYTYDYLGRRTETAATVDSTADFVNSYAYDALSRVTQIEQTSQSGGATVADKRVDLTYNAAGQFTGISRYADLSATELVAETSYTYDSDGRLTDLTHEKDTTTLADYSWTYDDAGRLSSVSSTDGTTDYTYDDTGQLTDADHSYQTDESFSYDDNGNRTNTGYQTGDNNRLLSDGTYDYEYDAEGNRTKRTNIATDDYTEYEWDHRNRLTAVTERDSNDVKLSRVEYTYDVFDRRIAKDIDSDGDSTIDSGERFVYDGEHIALSFDDSGSLTNRYLYGPAVDQVFASEDGAGDVLWALTDNLGTVRDIAAYDAVNDVTSVINHIQYDSFGNITSETDPQTSQAPTQGSVLNGDFRFSFTGREYDPETGQYYYRRRYYDPATGSFDSEDPLSFAAGDTNLQRYVFNSPTNYTDPSGLQAASGGGSDGAAPYGPRDLFNDQREPDFPRLEQIAQQLRALYAIPNNGPLFQPRDVFNAPRPAWRLPPSRPVPWRPAAPGPVQEPTPLELQRAVAREIEQIERSGLDYETYWETRAHDAQHALWRRFVGWAADMGRETGDNSLVQEPIPAGRVEAGLIYSGGGGLTMNFGPDDPRHAGGRWTFGISGTVDLPLRPGSWRWNLFNGILNP